MSYEKFIDVMDVIDIITDNEYISFSQMAKLINAILMTNIVKTNTIYRILLDKNVIAPCNETTNIFQFDNIKNCKYVPLQNMKKYCRQKSYMGSYYYIWDVIQIFKILNINLTGRINLCSATGFCTMISNYSNYHKFNCELVYRNFLFLQRVLKNESIYF